MKYYPEKEWNFAIYNNLESIMFGEINQRERQILYAITKYLASQCILQKKNKLTDIKNKLVVFRGKRGGAK